MSRRHRHAPSHPAFEWLESRILLSLPSKLPDLGMLHQAALLSGIAVEFGTPSTARATLGAELMLTLGTISVTGGPVLHLDGEELGLLVRRTAQARGYAIIPVVDWGDGARHTGNAVEAALETETRAQFTGRCLYGSTGTRHVRFEVYVVPEAGTRGRRKLLAKRVIDVFVEQGGAIRPVEVYPATATRNALQEHHLATFRSPEFGVEGLEGVVTWGDGATSAVRFDRNMAGDIEMFGTHQYTRTGTFAVSIALQQQTPSGRLIYRPMLTTIAVLLIPERRLHALSGTALSATLGAIGRPAVFEPAASPVTYRTSRDDQDTLEVTIDWGDGTIVRGSLLSNAADGYDILGNHTYRRAGDYAVHMEVIRGIRLGGAHHTIPYDYRVIQSLGARISVGRPGTVNGLHKLPSRGEIGL